MEKPTKLPYHPIDSLKYHLTCDFYGVKCRIRSDTLSAIEIFRASYKYFITDRNGAVDLDLHIFTSCDEPCMVAYVAVSKDYSLFEGEASIRFLGSDGSNRRLLFMIDIDTIETLTKEIDYYILGFVLLNLSQFLKVHAGVVAWGSDSIIIPGASGAGKTTLTYALTRKGSDLLSDELALIDIPSGDIYPFPRGLFLRRESFDLFNELRGKSRKEWFELNNERRYVVYPPADRVRDLSKPARPALMIFAEYHKDSQLALEAISAWSALTRLIGSDCLLDIALPEQLRKRSIDAMLAFLSRLSCYSLAYHDLEQALGVIQDVFAQALYTKAGMKGGQI